jgi:hypothetical protein
MSTVAVREKHKETHLIQRASIWETPMQAAFGLSSSVLTGFGGTGAMGPYFQMGTTGTTLYVSATASNTGSVTIVTYVNQPAAEEAEEYFKPHFAKHLRETLAAPSDLHAPEGEQEFIDWLNSD